MSEFSDAVRAVEATLFAAAEPMSADDIALYVGEGSTCRRRSPSCRRIMPAAASSWSSAAGAGISRPPPTSPTSCAASARRAASSRAAVETLAIIAYHEPVSRAEIEAIRGVQISKGTLDVLMEAGWVRPAGRREVPGRPLTYATTQDFLPISG